MIAIITGDVVHSRALSPDKWLNHLKKGLSFFGTSPNDWEIYRGDSFQFKANYQDALKNALLLKAWMKHFKEIDVRLSIGVEEQIYSSDKITESNGKAFELSGAGFDTLGKKNLSITTSNQMLNDILKVMCDLSLLIMDRWSERTAEVFFIKLKNPELNQSEIAKMLNIKAQGNISEALKRSGFDEIQQFIQFYQKTIKAYVDHLS